jgi:hypothetical protein
MDAFMIAIGGGSAAAVVSGVVQIALWVLNRRASKADKVNNGNREIGEAIRALLYDRVKYLGQKYISEGGIAMDDLESLLDMHNCYHDLQGNGALDALISKVKSLPIRK